MFASVYSGGSRDRRVHLCLRGFILAHLVVVGFILDCVGSLGGYRYRPVHSGSRVFTRARLGFVGFIQIHVSSHGRA